jgi:hypothetical protein
MSEDITEPEAEEPKDPLNLEIPEVRYSFREMMEEVEVERRQSVAGRELLDSNEISKMFAKRARKINKST